MRIWTGVIQRIIVNSLTEAELRRQFFFNYIGTWEEWQPFYDHNHGMPVCTRMILQHFHGEHDDTEFAYEYCPICRAFREPDNNDTEDEYYE